MKRTQKRGFTIVELVIVIAVIAILAAILIPTFSGIIEKANQSSDIQLVKNLNAALSVELQSQGNPNGRFATAYDSVVVCAKNGYLVDMIVAKSSLDIAWSRNTGTFMLINTGTGEVVYPTGDGTETLDATGDEINYFIFRSEVPTEGNDTKYSIFAGYGWNTKDVVINGVGFDAGYYTNVAYIDYINTTGSARDVLVRSNTFGTAFSVDGFIDPNDSTGKTGDTVTHYGFAGLVEIKKIANASYYENGIVGRLSITAQGAKGHVVIREGATVFQIEQLGGENTSVSVDAKASVYDINHELVTGAIERTSERFTTESTASFTVTETHSTKSGEGENAKNGERITAQECVHDYTVDILDSKHVYEVCKTCGYTLIKVGDEKQTVSKDAKDENEETVSENVIIPKATYGVDQVTANNNDKGDVKINIDSQTGEYVEPSVVSTPVVDDETAIDMTCKHDWKYTSNKDGSHKVTCSLCGAFYTEQCDAIVEACSKCGYSKYVAMNNKTNKYYKDAELAFNEAEDGQTVVILADVTVNKYNIPDEVEFDLNGHTIQVSQYSGLKAQWGTLFYNYYIWDNSTSAYADEEKWYDVGGSTTFQLYISGNWYNGYTGTTLMSYVDVNECKDNLQYDSIETYAKFSNTFNGNSTALKYFNGGYGTSDNPYEIAKPYQWNNISTGYSVTGNKFYELTDTVDFEGAAPGASFVNGITLYGNGKTIKNASGPLFSQNWINNGYFENFTFDNCVTYYNLFCNTGAYNTTSKLEFVNVDCTNCHAKNGCLFISWVYSNYNVSFKDCDIRNCIVDDTNYSQGFVGTFVGNSKSTVTVDNCKIYNTQVLAGQSSGAGFLGSSAGTIKNCYVDANCIFEQKDGQTVAAFGGGSVSDSVFYGALKGSDKSKVVYDGGSTSTGLWIASNPIATASDFVLNADGSISYTGTNTLVKIDVNQKFTQNRLKNGIPSASDSGMPCFIEDDQSHVFTNVTSGTELENAYHKITNIRNVGSAFASSLNYAIDELPSGLEFNTRECAIDSDGILYKDSSGSTYSDYIGSSSAGENGLIYMTVYIFIYNQSGDLINTITIGYSLQPHV